MRFSYEKLQSPRYFQQNREAHRSDAVWVALILFFVGWIGKNVCLLYGVELIP